MKRSPAMIVCMATLGFSSLIGQSISASAADNSVASAAAKNPAAAKAPAAARSPLFQSGIALYNARRYEEASRYFTEVVKKEPYNSEAFYCLGTCQRLIGDSTACTRLYEYIVKHFPESPAASSAKQYLEKNSAIAGAASADNQQQMKETVEAIKSAIKKTSAAPASMQSLVQIVRPRADRPNVSESAVMAIKQAVDEMPQSVKNVLWTSGVKIFVTPTVEDYEPGCKYQEARGYEGGTYKSCPAFYHNRKIVMAEHTMDENDESVKDAIPPGQMVNTLYHETGHALDFCLDNISHSEEFKHAYLLDSAQIDPATAHTLRYYLQKSEGGQQECCAELIGLLLGQTERHTTEMRASFPLTIKALKAKLGL